MEQQQQGTPKEKNPISRAKQLYNKGIISKGELDSILNADARFRFEETSAKPKDLPPASPIISTAARSAAVPSAPSSSSPPVIRSRQAIQAHRDAARRRGREERKAQVIAAEREAQMGTDRVAWERVLQDWENQRLKLAKLEPLCLRGVPPAVRSRAWSAMIGNHLQITPELYQITAERARATSQSQLEKAKARLLATCEGDDEVPDRASISLGKEASILLLEQDLPRTFPELAFFHDTGTLREVLQTFVCFRPDIGYVQGMSYLAAALLLYMGDAFECFKCFANMLNNHFFFDFYRLQRDKIDVHLELFEYYFHAKLPVLYNHFKQHGITTDMYYFEWSLTLMVKFVPLNICARIWDSYLLLGESFFIRAALGILRIFAETLGRMEMDEILHFLQRLPKDDMDEIALFSAIEDIVISPAHCEKVIRRIEDPNSKSQGPLECSPS